jgi:hypothetical protein
MTFDRRLHEFNMLLLFINVAFIHATSDPKMEDTSKNVFYLESGR